MGIGTGTRRATNRSNVKAKSVSLFMGSLVVSCLPDISEFLLRLADLNLLTLVLKMVLCQMTRAQVLLKAKENPRASVSVSQQPSLHSDPLHRHSFLDEAEFNLKRKRVRLKLL